MVNLKIEQVKEQLVSDEQTLSKIADDMGYSCIAYLSKQYRKTTGFSFTYFRNLNKLKTQINSRCVEITKLCKRFSELCNTLGSCLLYICSSQTSKQDM